MNNSEIVDKISACYAHLVGQSAAKKRKWVYFPRAVAYGPAHAHEGGGGEVRTMAEARRAGATNFRVGDGTHKGQPVLVADWPQHYFAK